MARLRSERRGPLLVVRGTADTGRGDTAASAVAARCRRHANVLCCRRPWPAMLTVRPTAVENARAHALARRLPACCRHHCDARAISPGDEIGPRPDPIVHPTHG